MKSIILLNPLLHSSRSGGIGEPIGLLSIAGTLRKHGYNVCVYDANAYNISVDDAIAELSIRKPDVVGITVSTPTIGYALAVARGLKRLVPSIHIVLGGVHATIFCEELLDLPYVDSVVKGEGELAVLDAVEFNGVFEKKVDNLDFVEIPAWSLIDLDVYKNYLMDGRFAFIMASRGCPFNCIFCSSHLMCGKRVRYRGVFNLAHELATLRSLKVKWIIFQDDTFTLNKDWVYDLCDVLEKNRFRWWCNTRVDVLDHDLLMTMKASGCEGFCVGIESGNQEILDKLRKGITLQQVRDGIDLIKSCGLKSYGYFMIGNLDDTNETLRDTVDFAKSLPLDYAQFSICTPFPATELYSIARERGVIGESVDWNKYDWESEPPNVSLVTNEERREWYKRAIREFYFRPRQLLHNVSWKGLKAGWRMMHK